jgi:hypothetical protein
MLRTALLLRDLQVVPYVCTYCINCPSTTFIPPKAYDGRISRVTRAALIALRPHTVSISIFVSQPYTLLILGLTNCDTTRSVSDPKFNDVFPPDHRRAVHTL